MIRYFYAPFQKEYLFTAKDDRSQSTPDKMDFVLEVDQRTYARMGGCDEYGIPVEDDTDEFGM